MLWAFGEPLGLLSLTLISAGEEKRFIASLNDEEVLSTLGEIGGAVG